MVHRIRGIADELRAMGETVRSEEVQSRLKAIQDESVRLQRDRKELLVDGANVIQLGRHRFAVNPQPIELTMVVRDDCWQLHITGTRFYSPVADPRLDNARDLWNQTLVSETDSIYRGEYLAYQLWRSLKSSQPTSLQEFQSWSEERQLQWLREQSLQRIREGYARGVHDQDAHVILRRLIASESELGLLRYDASLRSRVWFAWHYLIPEADRKAVQQWAESLAQIESIFPQNKATQACLGELRRLLQRSQRTKARVSSSSSSLTDSAKQVNQVVKQYKEKYFAFDPGVGSEYPLEQMRTRWTSQDREGWSWSKAADHAASELWLRLDDLARQSTSRLFENNRHDPRRLWDLAFELVKSYFGARNTQSEPRPDESEVACRLIDGVLHHKSLFNHEDSSESRIDSASAVGKLDSLAGVHPRIQSGRLEFNFHDFQKRLNHHRQTVEPRFEGLLAAKQTILKV
jgi:hypothetical protein